MAIEKDNLDQFRKWLVPFLMTLLGVLGGMLGSDIRSSQKTQGNDIVAIRVLVENKVTGLEKDVANNKENIRSNAEKIRSTDDRLDAHISSQNDLSYSQSRKRLQLKF